MNIHLSIASHITKLLDNQFKIFNYRIGIEPLLGLIPGIGDFISLGLSGYLLWIGLRMNLPREAIVQMSSNIMIDFLLGLIPIAGDIGDFMFKANARNLEILKKYAGSVMDGEIIADKG